MLIVVTIALAVIVLLGFVAQKFVPKLLPRFVRDYGWHISSRELYVGIAAATVAMALVMVVGTKMAIVGQLQFDEFRTGVEIHAGFHTEQCRPGAPGPNASSGLSNCEHQYDTGEIYWYEESYWKSEPYDCPSAEEPSKRCTRSVEKKRSVPAPIYAPFASKEYRYFITNSISDAYVFPKTYVKADEPYGNRAIPANLPMGQPSHWVRSKQRIEAGDPRSFEGIFTYENPIYATQDSMLLPYSNDVQRLLDDKLLPEHTVGINDQPLYGFSKSQASKVSFVQYQPADEAAWQESLSGLNAAVGSKLEGDIHLVVIDAKLVDSKVDYLNALKAYWLDIEYFGRRALAQNAIIVVVGAENEQVKWAIASTGMPDGNEILLRRLESTLPGTPLTPAAVIGDPRTVVTPAASEDEDEITTVTLSDKPGTLEWIILEDTPFVRACMLSEEGDDCIGYEDLIDLLQPKPWQYGVMLLIIMLLSVVCWVGLGFVSWARLNPQQIRKSTPSATYRRY